VYFSCRFILCGKLVPATWIGIMFEFIIYSLVWEIKLRIDGRNDRNNKYTI
jgi:hypothetical protein